MPGRKGWVRVRYSGPLPAQTLLPAHALETRTLPIEEHPMPGFRFALVLANGEPADPAVFATIIPRWQEGDTFLAGTDLQRFRIVAIAATLDAAGTFSAVWVVEPV